MSRLSLSKKLIIVIILAFVIMMINASFDLIYEYNKNTESLEVLETSLRENYDASIKMQIETLFTMIETLRIQSEADGMSEEENKKRVADVIRNIRYGENGYFWADTVEGDNIVLYGSETEGTNRYELQDSNGKYIIKDLIAKGLKGGGFTDYVFPKAGETNPQPKRAYSKYYEPFGWVIGTGIYTNDIDREIQAKQEIQRSELQRNLIIHLTLLLGFFGVVTILILVFSKKFVSMIIFSSTYAKAISEGDFGLSVPEQYLRRTDELGLLLHSLEDMKHSLINTFQEKEYANYQLSKEKEFLDTILETISEGIVVINETGRIQRMNIAAAKILEDEQSESGNLQGQQFSEIFQFSDSDYHEIEADDIFYQCKNQRQEIKRECYLTGKKKKICIEDSASPIIDQYGRMQGYVYVFRDISDRQKKQKEIEFLSYHDLLTGVYNRRYFDLKCRELVEESAYPLTIIVADVNALKLTNDAFGHMTGDKLIRSFAHVLRSVAKDHEYLFRIGGDEFVLLLPRRGKNEGLALIQIIKETLSRTFVGSIPLSAAFGCYTCESSDIQFEEAFRQADEAMYKNKLKENEAIKMAIIDSILNNNRHMFWNQPNEIQNVLAGCYSIGESLHFTPIELNRLLKAAAIYNIGYSTLDQTVVSKEDELNSREWDEIKKQPMAGYHKLKNTSVYADIAEIILEHHENIDGSGYPRGLTESQLHRETLVLSAVSDYYSMCSDRPYRKAMEPVTAIQKMREGIGKRYREDVIELLEKAVGM